VFGVPNARPIVRTETPTAPLFVAGDGQGLVNAAAAGLLANNPTIFYSASYAQNNAGLQAQLARGAVLVLTDTNQKQLDTWGTVDDNYGYVETANETPLAPNPAESALPVFPGAPTSTQTVAELSQVASVRATAYGNPITNTPENRPFEAVDGDIDTAWTEGAFSPAIGATLTTSPCSSPRKGPATATSRGSRSPSTARRTRRWTSGLPRSRRLARWSPSARGPSTRCR
jgi:arabinofuranan 3-O-arabinosyltransferase